MLYSFKIIQFVYIIAYTWRWKSKREREREEERETKVSPMNHNLMLILMNSYPILNALRGNFLGYNVLKYWGSHWPKILCRNLARWSWLFDAIIFWVSSQLVTWPTCNQVNLYPGSPLVTTMEKSTRNQSLGYELTHSFQGERSTLTWANC